jgi:hypothetical protein
MRRSLIPAIWILLAVLSSGCVSSLRPEPTVSIRPKNVFQLTSEIPSTIRRVALLPISSSQPDAAAHQLQGVLKAELNHCGQFEVIEISPEQMALWTGRREWRPEEPMPADFIERVARELDCDAILFSHLAAYQPYKPILIGWNIKLVETNTGSIFWAVDEVFDSADADVAKGASRYGQNRVNGWGKLGQEDAVLLSPRKFAQFTLAAVFETLPTR